MDTRSTPWPMHDKKRVYQNSGVRVRAVIDDSHVDDDTETDT
jgi:hypothetical protein